MKITDNLNYSYCEGKCDKSYEYFNYEDIINILHDTYVLNKANDIPIYDGVLVNYLGKPSRKILYASDIVNMLVKQQAYIKEFNNNFYKTIDNCL